MCDRLLKIRGVSLATVAEILDKGELVSNHNKTVDGLPVKKIVKSSILNGKVGQSLGKRFE